MNQQLFPQSVYPITGDVQSTPGQSQIRVVGLQGVPISIAGPIGGNVLTYIASTGQYTPSGSVLNNDSISVNGVPVSDDYSISVKSVSKDILINSTIPQNSKPVFVNGA